MSFDGFFLSLMSKVDPSSGQIFGMNINIMSLSMFKMNKNIFLEKIHLKNAENLSFLLEF